LLASSLPDEAKQAIRKFMTLVETVRYGAQDSASRAALLSQLKNY